MSDDKTGTPTSKAPAKSAPPPKPLHPVFDIEAVVAGFDPKRFGKKLAHELTVRGFTTPESLKRPNYEMHLRAALNAALNVDVSRLMQSVKEE